VAFLRIGIFETQRTAEKTKGSRKEAQRNWNTEDRFTSKISAFLCFPQLSSASQICRFAQPMRSIPPIYDLSASGMETDPSAFW